MQPVSLSTWTSCRPRLFARALTLAASFFLLIPGSSSAKAQNAPVSGRIVVETFSALASPYAVNAGPLPASERLSLTLTLATSPARATALQQFLLDVTTPGKSEYHRWLTPVEFGTRFGATAGQISAATQWAQAAGLSVDTISPAAERMTISGFTAQIQSVFAVSMNQYRLGNESFYAPDRQPTLPTGPATLFAAIDGLDSFAANSNLTTFKVKASFAALAARVDGNAAGLLELSSGICRADEMPSLTAQYTALLEQAESQGITILVSSTCVSGGFPGDLSAVTALALPEAAAETTSSTIVRPGWQVAPGLPSDALRHSPDLTATSVDSLAATLTSIASSTPSRRLGNINPVLYQLSPEVGVFTQADAQTSGTWERTSGLGLVDLDALAKHYPRGAGSSFTSFSASNYSPVHGQNITFTGNVTSGTGGAIPTGTASFVTGNGATLGTGTLVPATTESTATYTSNTLNGGSYGVLATYSGDGTYASSSSGTGTVLVQPEASQLAATVSSNNTVGGTFSVVVTDTAASGVGIPAGTITVTVSGTSETATGTLVPSGANVSSVTITLPANTVGGQTLSINCSGDQNYSCYNPLTKGVTIGKATPTLNFSYSPNPAISGATITLNASLAAVGNAPVPSGNVEFFDGTTVLGAGVLKDGATTIKGILPTTDTHSISATYDSDANYNGVTVSGNSSPSGPMATNTSLQTANASPVYGQGATFTATVAVASGGSSATGTVTFIDSVSGICGRAILANGTAFFLTTTLPGGVSTVTASYGGDTTHSSSVSSPVTETVMPEAAQVTLQVPSTATFGSSIPVTVTVTGSTSTVSSPPTGSVTLTPGGTGYTDSYTSALSSAGGNTGSATFSVPGVAAGTIGFSATYTGDRNYAAAGPTTTSATIARVGATTTLSLNPVQPITGQSTVLSAQVMAVGSVGPAGTVTFTNGGVVLGSSSLNSNGIATLTTSFTAGNHVLAAQYNGDTNYNISTSPSVNTITGTVTTTTALVGSATTFASGKNFTLTVNVAPSTLVNGAQPTGTVQILDAGVVLATAGLNSGTATLTTSLISVRTHSLIAFYSGDSNYEASASPAVPFGVSVVTTTTAFSASSYAITTGQSVTITATIQPVTTVNGSAPTGTVLFSSAAQGVVGSGQVSNGVATFTTATLAAGVYNLTATYSGDVNYASSASIPSTTLTVTSVSTVATLTATLSPTTAVAGTTATVTATVTLPGTTAPAGTALATIVLTGSTSTNAGTLSATGINTSTAIIPLTVPVAGTYSVIVGCPTNATYTCNSVTLTLISTASAKIATSTVLTLLPTTPVAGNEAILTATVASATIGATALSGTVSFYSGLNLIGTGTIARGVATLSYTFPTNAAQILTATYSGDTLYLASTSPLVSTGVGLATTTTTLTYSVSQLIAGGTITLTAQVAGTSAAGTSPTGTVSFYVSGIFPRLLGSGTLSATGTGLSATSLFTTQIPSGSQTLYAVYLGDSTFQTSTSASVGIGLTDYSVSFTPATLSLTAGQTGSVGIVVTPSGAYTGVVAMNCVPPANAQISCSISPQSLSNGGTAVLTINSVASQSKTAASSRVGPAGREALGGASLAAVLGLIELILPGRKRRRLPAILLVMLAVSLGINLGCSQQNFSVEPHATTGSPLGTAALTINTSGSNGVTAITHDYTYLVTIQ